ncbi:hypothetical protein ACRQGA_09215, partial [Actinotignum sp. GS-2025b]
SCFTVVILVYLLGGFHPHTQTIRHSPMRDKFGHQLSQIGELLGIPAENRAVIYQGEESYQGKNFAAQSAAHLLATYPQPAPAA